MKHLTAGEASRLAGVSKATICRALKSGKLSYVSNDSEGYRIDPAELSRVYSVKHHETPLGVAMKRYETPNETPQNDHEKEILELKIKYLEEKLKMVEEKIDDLKAEKEKWEEQARYWRQLNFLRLKPAEPVKCRKELIRRVQKDTINKYRKHLSK
jgi:DNA-binding transcriptional MerR regulator